MSLFRSLTLCALSLTCLSAAPVFSVVPGGDVIASVADFGSGVTFLDVRGTTFVGVEDGGFLGAIVLVTPAGAPTFGNNIETAVNFPGISESGSATFDFSSPSLIGPFLFLNATLTPSGVITDPALAAFLSAGSATFGFGFLDTTDLGGAALTRFGLISIEPGGAIPEPASVAMFAGGAIVLLVSRRLRG